MVTTLYLIRHGETAGGDAKRYHDRIDTAKNIIAFWEKYPLVKLLNGLFYINAAFSSKNPS